MLIPRLFASTGLSRSPRRHGLAGVIGTFRAVVVGTSLLGLLAALALPGPVLAHERREVGPYTFVVGFLNEPALAGEPNGIDLRITRTDTGAPVENAHQTLRAAIAFGGGQPKEFPLRARFGQPGAYTADVIPTRAGSYIFTFTGSIEGTPVNQRFESGPGRFNDVESPERIQFPEPAPPPAQLATTVRQLEERATEAEARAAAAEGRAGLATAFGVAGTLLGLVGLTVGTVAWLAARRANGAAAHATARGHSPVQP